MNETEKIVAELKARATDAQQAEQLQQLYQEIVARFESGFSEGVAELLQEKMTRLRQDFNQAHTLLRSKLDGRPDGSAR
jgi:hypothetical protein